MIYKLSETGVDTAPIKRETDLEKRTREILETSEWPPRYGRPARFVIARAQAEKELEEQAARTRKAQR